MPRFSLHAATAGIALACLSLPAQAVTDIQWWHSLNGKREAILEEITEAFNSSQEEYRVFTSFRGTGSKTVTKAIDAVSGDGQPHILQVPDAGTGTLMRNNEGIVYPLHELMEEHSQPLDTEALLPAIAAYYRDAQGKMPSFPLNVATPVMYYNRDVFKEAGLDPDEPPTTWYGVAQAATAITNADAAECGFTAAWPSWIMLENFSAVHNLAIATQQNGFGGLDAKLAFNNEEVARHWENLHIWQGSDVFRWSGADDGPNAEPMFYAQACAMFLGSSAARADVLNNASFDVGYARQPYYDDVEGAPQNAIIGGSSLWALRGHTDAEYEAVAAFFDYLSKPAVQAKWHQKTGYLPITKKAQELSEEQGFYKANPGASVALEQLTLKAPTANAKGTRLGNFMEIRKIITEEMEAVMNGKKSGEEATDDAVSRGNQLLRDFEAANS
ncbi:sn-glycerol-3-phosphate ABC transporter substrate-binding protein UgpB [Halomonas garicola]|uniref:sn-glycerol-3-phosphate ABC transporter substrate-binding protein UgpB n=1 Tax=Halomonas garicola TaxID=1690008 RepID=UPI0028A2CA37|nr:sn-glycerol-3-phosphate ABC transporter substrate-binding protein UgpB [Halomonas garicola]